MMAAKQLTALTSRTIVDTSGRAAYLADLEGHLEVMPASRRTG
jgi:hypothetical protein